MAAAHARACFLLLMAMTAAGGGTPDIHVTCLFSEDCILPCSFESAGHEVIHWYRQEVLVHSFLEGRDQLDQQHQQYAGRTSLVDADVAHGNASLRILRCGPQDRGRYKCLVQSGQEQSQSFVVVRVEAPIRSVSLEMTRLSGYEELRCSAHGIYPGPQVTWSTQPPTPASGLRPSTRKVPDTQGLYSVESKLQRLEARPDLTYTCTINSAYGTHNCTVSLREREMAGIEGQELTIPCEAPRDLKNFLLTWTFTKVDVPQIILTYNSSTQNCSSQWQGQATLAHQRAQAGDGGLRLLHPRHLVHSGKYTCLFSGPTISQVVHTELNINAVNGLMIPRNTSDERLSMGGAPKWWIAGIVLAVLAIGGAAVVGILKLRAKRSQAEKNIDTDEMQPVRRIITVESNPCECSHFRANDPDGHT